MSVPTAPWVASAARGITVYAARCSGCHSEDAHRVGPLHRGVLGRRAGALPNYDYSPALRDSKLLWTRATLTAWLADPEAVIPGQGMDYQLEDARERADVVAYLATLKRPSVRP
ncbi:c-type cytochrome [Paracidovorax sp. MALMAid1276]|uniref:c-type cytochrome n=1 Tax=Paracidovorax sp. MALMAid1276 TaxID=3411631 RepID=UPI003B98F3B7